MFLAKIYITLKPTVNDPQGQTIHGSLKQLNFKSVDGVRVGKYIEIRINEQSMKSARDAAKSMCEKLLTNPVIEDFRLDIEQLS